MNGKRVEALNETECVCIWMIWDECRQSRSYAAVGGDQHRCSLAAKIGGDPGQVRAGRISHGENEHRIVFLYQANWAVLEFGVAERLGMDVADLLQLQRGLACDGKRGPAAQDDEAARHGVRTERLRPIELGSRS